DALELAPRDRQIAPLLRATRQHDRVMASHELLDRHIDADMSAVVKDHALRLHLGDAMVDVMLLHLEIGNAVPHQAAGLGGLPVEMDFVAGARELLRAGHAGWP